MSYHYYFPNISSTVITKIIVDCSICEGKGKIEYTGQAGLSEFTYTNYSFSMMCMMCDGLGKVKLER